MRKSYLSLLILSILISSIFAAPLQVAKAQGLSFPAEINKRFSPISISSGGTSRLSVTIYNPNSFQLTSASWTDNLSGVQAGIVINNPVNLSNSCGGSITAVAGQTTLSLSGGTVPAQVGTTPGSCTVSIDVTSTTPGNLINTIPGECLEFLRQRYQRYQYHAGQRHIECGWDAHADDQQESLIRPRCGSARPAN